MAQLNMTAEYRTASSPIQWGLASRPLTGMAVNGDFHLVRSFQGGILAGAIDGLGHGEEAHQASHKAADVLVADLSAGLVEQFERLNVALKSTRGAVATLIKICPAENVIEWAGVGNVTTVLYTGVLGTGTPTTSLLRQEKGVVGGEFPKIRTEHHRVERGDVLVLATDGIRPEFTDAVFPRQAPQQIATHVMEEFASGKDDALVLVIRYVGMN